MFNIIFHVATFIWIYFFINLVKKKEGWLYGRGSVILNGDSATCELCSGRENLGPLGFYLPDCKIKKLIVLIVWGLRVSGMK